jgi:NAD(P)-dependent dehydrogenase (short-subunit alcohol dehydrogenase family)
LTSRKRPWQGEQAYSDTKFHDLLLAFAVARRWPGVLSNALEPGSVQTKMGGAGATDELDEAHRTQAWLAASDDAEAMVSGEYFYHMKRGKPEVQEQLRDFCLRVTGVELPS